ncbi:amino acid adenylation domain-containing protein [Actinomadura sp. 21ATH]|uniref:amino acid adenylation domain-containing protein n=1 Tax=Actinomadura sp. 21ATH TaxID=1735444 RepID=UPI0035C1D4B6
MNAPVEPTALGAERLREELLRRRRSAGARRAASGAVVPVDRGGPLPLSSGQEQLWFLNRLDPGSAEYHAPLLLRMRGRLDERCLRAALVALVERHEILRTRFPLADGRPRQVIDPAGGPPLAVRHLPGIAEPDRAARAVEEAAAAEPFDLGAEPPLRAGLLRFAADDHVLVLMLHHIAVDAASYPVIIEELAAFYRAAAEGAAAPIAPLPVQYADYAAWERERLAAPLVRRHLDHWRRRLDGLAPLDLPADRPRPAVRDWRGASLRFTVPDPLAARLRGLARERGASPFMLLLTAFQVLLGRYARTGDVAVGTSVSGRSRPELQPLVGYLSNPLVLRARWTGDPRFGDLLERNRDGVLTDFEHRELPFGRLVAELEPERDLSRTPLYQVMFDMRSGPAAAADFPGLRVEPVEAGSGVAKFDLTLLMVDEPGGPLTGHLEYATALFDRATAGRIAGHYRRLLASIAATPDARLSALGVLGDEERAVLLGGPPRPPSGLGPVHEVFERQAAATPDATAVVAGAERWTYARLDARADQIAHHLRALGAGPEDRVGVLLDRGPELVACLLGVWKAGAAQVPLDPDHPPGRLALMLDDAGARIVLTESRHAAAVAHLTAVPVDAAGTGLADRPSAPPAVPAPADPDSLAYIIYTSGSTGRPKGVLVHHRGLANYLGWTLDAYASAGDGGAPVFSSVAFDLGVPDLYAPLLAGRPVRLLPQDLDVAELGRLLAEGAPYAFVKLTPGHLDLLTEQLTPAQARGLAGLVIAAGDAFTTRLARRWRALAGPDGTRLAAEYGPTEITVGNSAHFPGDAEPGELVSIGSPIPGTTMYVLDEHLRPLPLGVVGEVCIGGAGVARGYAGRPDLTAERFVPDPYGPPGSRLYRSGDLGRMTAAGTIDFVARADHQVKIRGHRIEPGEVAAALCADPRVADAVVVAAGGRLAGYVVPRAPAEWDPAGLLHDLAERLPAYMLPASLARLDRIPLTPNGKVDRDALPDPDAAAPAGAGHVPPRTPAEERVARAWAEVLGRDRVGVHDGFFDSGGDSLRAVALVGALRAAGMDVTVRDVFERRTIAELCVLITGRPAPAEDAPPVAPFALLPAADRAALPGGIADAYPMSRIQTGMALEMAADSEHRYHNHTSFRIRDERPFDPDAFRRALALIVARHEAMRTGMDLAGHSVPVQLVHERAEMPFGTADLRGLDAGEQGRLLREHARRERRTPFDLARPPLMRMFVHVMDGTGWWLSITEFHGILEGWSYHTQLMELLGAYRRLRDGREPEPARPPAVRYADFIAAEQRSLASAEDRGYWRRIVREYPKFELEAGHGEPPERYEGALSFADLEAELRAAAARAKVPLKAVLHAAFLTVLATYTPERRFFSGMVCDARPEVLGADRVSGMYLNSVPFAFDGVPGTWRELVRQVFAREIELWPHRRFPMPEIQRELGRRPIDALFHYLDFYQVDTELVDFEASIDESPNEFALCVGAMGTRLLLSTSTRVLPRAEGARFLEKIRLVLEEIVRDLDGDARTGPLTGAERHRLIERGRGPAGPAGPVCVTAAFERQAGRTPDAAAVIAGERRLTFRELDERADALARALRDLGAAPGSVVAVLLTRDDPDLPAALLGAWKAGCAYLALDTAHPARRIALTLADAAVSAVLTAPEHRPLLDPAHAPGPGESRAHALDEGRAPVQGASGAPGPDMSGAPGPDAGRVPVLDVSRVPAGGAGRVPRRDDLDAPAYVAYTSGSTGRPKGVLVSHRGLACYLDWAVAAYAGAGTGGAPLLASVAFDIAVPALFAPWLAGQPLHLLPAGLGPADLGPALREAGPFSFVELTPGQLAWAGERLGERGLADLAGLIVTAGEGLRAGQAERWRGAVRLGAEYGPTEATVGCAYRPVDGPVDTPSVPLGDPIPGAAVHVLDERLEPVPPGVAGEVCVGGPGVALGYLGRPALTAERFVPDPYGPPGSRLFRTGDLARREADGTLVFLGRADRQLKIRGHRVEPGEIEAALTGLPGVADAAVVADRATSLTAYVVPGPDGTVRPEELRGRLAELLPAYLLPSRVVAVERLPLTANGKLDRDALEAAGGAAGRAPAAGPPPATPAERRLAEIWSRVLGTGPVAATDRFADLGGDSLALLHMIAAARRAGLRLEPSLPYRDLTLARLAALAEGATGPDGRTEGRRPCDT